MFFKKLEMLGFKSFADKIDINFEPGVTAIVGPNGCGKTNIVDATKWVLGEQSVKQLRGNRMEDIIFNGTGERKPLGLAEVSITLDNSKHLLPVDFEEVTVTRRIFRSGESEYYINKAPCRLKDISEMFMDTGLSVDTYCLMQQDRVDYIINSKPEERRFILEEAAGITKYKAKKEEAVRKLERAKENLTRISDITGEVKKQINALDYQARKARQYRKLGNEIKSLEMNNLCSRYLKLKQSSDSVKKGLDETSVKIEDLNTQITKKDSLVSGLHLQMQEMEKEFVRIQESIFSFTSDAGRAEDRIEAGKQRREEIGEQIKGLREEMADAGERLKNLEKETEEAEKQKKESGAVLEKHGKELAGEQESLAKAEGELTALKNSLNEKRNAAIELLSSAAKIRNQLETMENEEKNNRTARKDLLDEEGVINAERRQVENDLDGKKEHMKELITKFADLTQKRDLMVEKIRSVDPEKKLAKRSPAVYDVIVSLSNLLSRYSELLNESVRHIEKLVAEKKKESDAVSLRLSRVVEKRNAIEKHIFDSAKRFSDLKEELRDDEKAAETSRALITELEEEVHKMEESYKQQSERVMEIKMKHFEIKQYHASLESGLKNLFSQKKDLSRSVQHKKEAVEGLEEKIKSIEKERQSESEKISGSYRKKDEADNLLKGVRDRKESVSAALREEEKVLSELRRELSEIQKGYNQERVGDAQMDVQIKQIVDELGSDYAVSLDAALEAYARSEKIVEGEEYEASIQKLKHQVESMGAVNLAAPEEYDKLNERFSFLNKQEQDLVKACEDLYQVIGKINRVCRSNFETTFAKVRENFKNIFKELFEGGMADLVLMDEQNMLESGIEIIAQPPGKKLQSISLLSGGEKALCAISLLFALFMVKPTPFCILDEIDAPLDDSNLLRFTRLLKEFVPNSQFIVITHNKRTMEIADVLYGVTMEELGVSNVISVRLQQKNP